MHAENTEAVSLIILALLLYKNNSFEFDNFDSDEFRVYSIISQHVYKLTLIMPSCKCNASLKTTLFDVWCCSLFYLWDGVAHILIIVECRYLLLARYCVIVLFPNVPVHIGYPRCVGTLIPEQWTMNWSWRFLAVLLQTNLQSSCIWNPDNM